MGEFMNILITGGTSGIALKVAKRVSDNNKVYLGIHTIKQLNNIKLKLKEYKNIIPIKLDVTSDYDIKKLKRYNINVLYLHAGVGIGGSVLDVPINKIKENYDVNIFGSINVLKVIYKYMYEIGSGRIVIMSSLLGIIPFKFLGIYSSTKSALISLSIALKKELTMINKNIKICLIEPGAYKTGFNEVMLENKYDYIKKSVYFKHRKSSIRKKESRLFKLIEKKNLNSIVEKIEDAITSKNPRFIYRAPFLQSLLVKFIYFLFY